MLKMKKRIALTTLILLSLVSLQAPSLAKHHDDWFKNNDQNHDGKWDYDEYCAWQRAHGKHLSDRQLHELYEKYDRNRDTYWQEEEARRYHH